MFHRFVSYAFVAALVFAASPAQAKTVRISDASTKSANLPEVVDETLKTLAGLPEERHVVILEGSFKPSSTIKFLWSNETKLTVTASTDSKVVLDGAALPEGKETVFMAGQNITLQGIHFANSQGHAVVVGGNSDSYVIKECTFEDCRQGAIHVWNDPHTVLKETNRRGTITANRVARFNLAGGKWSNDGITVFDQRVTISHNSISDSPTETNGIRAMGRDLVVERNRISNVSIDDSGGIYLWGGPHASLFRGNIVRGNHVTGASRGIYLDDGTSGATVAENVIERSSVCAVFVSGGRENVIHRNVIDDAPVFFHLDSRCLGWDSRPEFQKMVRESFSRLSEALIDKSNGPLLRKRYAELQGLSPSRMSLQLYAQPEGNRVSKNFVRSVEANWELMDFATAVTTDFSNLNELEMPLPFDSSDDLSQLSFRRRFGFLGLDRLQDVLNEVVAPEWRSLRQ